jgi:hypothetical protein
VKEVEMDREEVLQWFEKHPGAIEGDLGEFVSRCESAVRRHAREEAWLAARDYVEARRHEQERSSGARASEAYVAQEVCHQLAYELRRHEPVPRAEDVDRLAGGPNRRAVSSEAWHVLIPWIVEVARKQEHETWLEIVRYTDKRARELIRQHHLSSECDFDHTQCYGTVATRIERLLERDFVAHAFPH